MLNTSQIAKDFSSILQPIGTKRDNIIATFSKNIPRISTGYMSIDKALNGGLIDELYIMGSETSTGKSALMMSFAQNIVKQGVDVLYFALEMKETELIARTISSASYVANLEDPIKKKFTAGDVIYWLYNEQFKVFTKVPYTDYSDYVDQYFDTYGDHLYIIDSGVGGLSAKDITDIATMYRGLHPEQQMVVFVDYMQYIKADPGDHSQSDRKTKIDRSVEALKALSSQIDVPVFAASSVGRMSYGQKVSTSSFKESGDTEYTGGVLIGWNWVGVTDAKDEDTKKKKEEESDKRGYRIMSFDIIKFRNSRRNHEVKLKYYHAYNYLTEISDFNEDNKPERIKY